MSDFRTHIDRWLSFLYAQRANSPDQAVGVSELIASTLAVRDAIDNSPGTPGVGITGTAINPAGHLLLSLSNGTTVDAGPLPAAPAVQSVQIDTAGHLKVTLSNGDVLDAGSVPGAVSVTNAQINVAGHLIVSLSNGTQVDAGSVPGAVSVTGVQIDGTGHLQVTLSNGSVLDAGSVPGAVSVTSAAVDGAGVLKVTLSDGSVVSAGSVRGAAGVGVSGGAVNASGELVLTLTNNQTVNVGSVKGGPGAAGVGISGAAINGAGNLILTLSNNTTVDAGKVAGTVAGGGLTDLGGGSNNHLVVVDMVNGALKYRNALPGDQTKLDMWAFRGADGVLNGPGSLVAAPNLVPGAYYRLAPVAGGRNYVPLEATPPTPSATFTLCAFAQATPDGAYLRLHDLLIPDYPEVVTPSGLIATYDFVRTNEATKLYPKSGTVAATALLAGAAYAAGGGLSITAETDIDLPIAVADGVMTAYFSGKQVDLAADRAIFGTTNEIGDPHAYWRWLKTGTQAFYSANNNGSAAANGFTGAGAAAPAGVRASYCLVINGLSASLYDSGNSLLGTITLGVKMPAFTRLWLGRRHYPGLPFLGRVDWAGFYHAAHTDAERAAAFALLASDTAGRA